ncbi:hypothetical protein LOZ53_003303 [Ophidiomyces ophidiicola]|nr:hypothetical protein LOZ53_003303 [Ophidiomyces ophidiicola]
MSDRTQRPISSYQGVNPAFAASFRQQAEAPLERVPSDVGSLSTGIVDPGRMVKPRHRAHLPPIPDLRFEQSYLASLRGADTWGRVAWITMRDQQSSKTLHTLGSVTFDARHNVDSGPVWLEILASRSPIQRPDNRICYPPVVGQID